jgi:hypothetical protein
MTEEPEHSVDAAGVPARFDRIEARLDRIESELNNGRRRTRMGPLRILITALVIFFVLVYAGFVVGGIGGGSSGMSVTSVPSGP